MNTAENLPITSAEYDCMVERLMTPPSDITASPVARRWMDIVTGLVAESGELVDAIRYGNRDEIVSELGDVAFFLTALRLEILRYFGSGKLSGIHALESLGGRNQLKHRAHGNILHTASRIAGMVRNYVVRQVPLNRGTLETYWFNLHSNLVAVCEDEGIRFVEIFDDNNRKMNVRYGPGGQYCLVKALNASDKVIAARPSYVHSPGPESGLVEPDEHIPLEPLRMTWQAWDSQRKEGHILDPDGFRDLPMDALYTKEQFDSRLGACTQLIRTNANEGPKGHSGPAGVPGSVSGVMRLMTAFADHHCAISKRNIRNFFDKIISTRKAAAGTK